MKYYVATGSFNNVIIADDPESAAIESFKTKLKEKEVGSITQVNEIGFESNNHDDNYIFNTQDLIEKAGLNYKSSEWVE